jgi:hypothetical protein
MAWWADPIVDLTQVGDVGTINLVKVNAVPTSGEMYLGPEAIDTFGRFPVGVI